jgi:pimeloyl-ACP methyl ester carboxylesterase
MKSKEPQRKTIMDGVAAFGGAVLTAIYPPAGMAVLAARAATSVPDGVNANLSSSTLGEQNPSPISDPISKDPPILGPSKDRDPLGLLYVYGPEEEYKVDIVFVHGLGGSSRKTWSKNKDLRYFRPQTFLPLEPKIREARISSFGYNSNYKETAGKLLPISDFAKDLLFHLKYAKYHDGEDMNFGAKPIIYIAHSMGGLVVKKVRGTALHSVPRQLIVGMFDRPL